MRNLINVQKIQQHFIKVIKLTREVSTSLIYRKKDELVASYASYLGSVWKKLGLESLACITC